MTKITTGHESKVIEILDEMCGYLYYCDECGSHIEGKVTQDMLPMACDNCGMNLMEIEKI